MTQEEYTKLEIGDVLFRRSDNLVVILSSGWASGKEFEVEDYLWTEKASHGGLANILARECEAWQIVRSIKDFDSDPIAYCNWLKMRMDDLYALLK